MPPRRRKKPPNPTLLSLLFTCLYKLISSVPECKILGHISQFIELGKIVGLGSNFAPISDRFRGPLSPTIQRFGNPKRLHTSSYVIYFHLCSSCSGSAGLNLPCSGLGCSSLGSCLTFVSPQWPIRSLRVPPLKSSLAFIDYLIINLGCEYQPWRLPSLDISSPEFLVACGGFACYGRGRSSTPTSVLVIRSRGPICDY